MLYKTRKRTALDRGRTNRICLTNDLDIDLTTLTFNPLRAMVMTYSHANVEGQRSAGPEDKVETNGRTDRRTDEGDCITSRVDAVAGETLRRHAIRLLAKLLGSHTVCNGSLPVDLGRGLHYPAVVSVPKYMQIPDTNGSYISCHADGECAGHQIRRGCYGDR